MAHLILVHGIGGKPAPDVLHDTCRSVLTDASGINVAADQLRIAYWADLADYPPEEDDPGTFRPLSFAERLTSRVEGAVKARVLAEVEPRLRDALRKDASPNNTEAATVAGLLAFINGPMALFVLKEFLQDVYQYFRGGIREAVKDRLRQQLDAVPAGSTVGLIGHSLGSVVALDVLTSDHRRVELLVTLGSPLGLAAVQDQMGLTAGGVAGVADEWHNLADRIDPVALDDTLADDFANAGVADGLIENEYVNSAGHRNAHRLYGYLHAPATGRLVKAFME